MAKWRANGARCLASDTVGARAHRTWRTVALRGALSLWRAVRLREIHELIVAARRFRADAVRRRVLLSWAIAIRDARALLLRTLLLAELFRAWWLRCHARRSAAQRLPCDAELL